MAVLDFEAYELEYLVEGQSYRDEDGHYHKGKDEWVSVGRCNAVPAGRNNLIALPDENGTQVAFSFSINLHDPDSREFKYGEKIRLKTIDGHETIELTVKGFARYQLQCKIYV